MPDEPLPPSGGDAGSPHSFYQNFQHTPVGARIPEKISRGVFSTAVMILQTNEIFVLDFLSMMAQPQQVVARIVMTASNFSQFIAALRVNIGNYERMLGPLKGRMAVPPTVAPRPAGEPGAPSASGMPGAVQQMPPAAGAEGQGGAPGGGQPAESGAPKPIAQMVGHHDPAGPASITDLYEQIKFPEELFGGVFSNAVMIRHTQEEFCFDFIANLFPRPMVVSRVFVAATRIPALLEALAGSLARFERSLGLPPPPPPPTEP